MTDATQTSVSDEAEVKAAAENAKVAAAETETGAVTSTDKPAPEGVIEAEPEKKEKPEPVVNPRDAKRAQIAAKRSEQMEQDKESMPEIPAEAMGIPETDPEPAAQGGVVKLKVNGEEQEVPAEKVLDAGIRTLQKETAADAKLEQAGKRMSDLDAREQRIAQREQELASAALEGGGSPAPSTTVDVPETDIDAEEIVDDLYSGDKEKAVKAVESLRGVTATAHPQTVDPNEVATIVEQRQEAKATLSRFYGRYPDIQADPNLKTIVNNESKRIRQEHPEYNQEQLLMESGRVVTEKYGGRVVDDTGFSQKADRKAQTDTVTGADVVRQPQPEQQPKSRSSVVQDMRAGRR